MIPVLSHIEQIDDLSIWKTTDGKSGIGFEITPCDLECDNREEYHRKVFGLIRSLNPNILGRVKLSVTDNKKQSDLNSRTEAISEIGFTTKSLQLYLETTAEPEIIKRAKSLFSKNVTDKDTSALLEVYEIVKKSGLQVQPIGDDFIKSLFLDTKLIWQKCSASVCNGYEHTGIVRMIKPSNEEISEEQMAKLFNKLPKPFNVHFSFQKIDAAKIKIELERKLKQSASDKSLNPTNDLLKESTISTISDAVKNGSQFFNYELIFSFERTSENELFEDLKQGFNVLNSFADFQIETFGVTPNFLATKVGNSQHVPLKEIDDIIPLFMPVWFFGETTDHPGQRSLMLHRLDRSLHAFDLFNSNFNVFNSLIVGTSGKGKSVLTGMLTQALLNDPNVAVIKLDVGGSHSKECELLDGQEFVLQLNTPSGINPFLITKQIELSESEKIGILSRFLMVLIQEQGELLFSKDLRSKIEECIQVYLSNAKNPSLQEFYDLMADFPRRNLLRRWVSGGVYEKAFASSTESTNIQTSRLRYYNFSQVFQASDPEFAQAGLAAVLAQFNVETLINKDKRIVLICDETPFFIKSCFDFFKFSTANVRKFGHAVILITQLSTDLIVNGDTGIIENSPQRFLFSIDGDLNDYQARFNLTKPQISSIRSLKAIPKEFSEVFLQTSDIGRKLLIKITKKEYWALTSSKQDREKLEKLRSYIPNLSLTEAIKCLSIA